MKTWVPKSHVLTGHKVQQRIGKYEFDQYWPIQDIQLKNILSTDVCILKRIMKSTPLLKTAAKLLEGMNKKIYFTYIYV